MENVGWSLLKKWFLITLYLRCKWVQYSKKHEFMNSYINQFVLNAPFLYPMKASEKR